jgi:hypothetical protein
MKVKKREGVFTMKNILKILGIIALVAVIGLGMAACGDGGDNGGGGGGGNVAWADIVGDWTSTSASLIVHDNKVIQYTYDFNGDQRGGSLIQCSISGTTLKDGDGRTFTISLSSDKKTLTLSNSSSNENRHKALEGIYTKEGGEQPTPPNPPAGNSLNGTTWNGIIMGEIPCTLTFTATTYTITFNSPDIPPDTGSYTISGSSVTIFSTDQMIGTMPGTLSGNTLTFDKMGGMTFTKQ